MFQTACQYFKQQGGTPFLWLEPDCTLMHPHAIEQIQAEYSSKGKAFMGADVNGKHLSGIAVYPAKAQDEYRGFFGNSVSDRAWDYAVDARPLANITKKIEHFWGRDGLPPHFVERRSKSDPVNYRLANSVSPDTAIFHRDKDASLSRIVIKKSFENKVDVGMIMLGRYGDICNVLPIAQEIFRQTNEPPLFAFSRDFEDIMDGVNYACKLPLDIPYLQRQRAVEFLRGKCHNLLVPQVCGTGYDGNHRTDSFTKEQWRLCGFLDRFYNKSLRLEFDNRDRVREAMLIDRLPLIQNPTLLYSLTSGHSSPFAGGHELAEEVVKNLEGWQCINLDEIKAEKPFDLLALYESSTVLLTTDTMHVHLASATDIPVVLLTGEIPWLRSISRAKVSAKFHYSESLERSFEIIKSIKDAAQVRSLRRTPRSAEPIRS